MSQQPIVAIVGRPNVGKSTLFNRIVGNRVAIVDDTPGVTRDRIYQQAEWLGRTFTLVDTGGITDLAAGDFIEKQMRYQAQVAIAEADLIVFVVDSRTGLTPDDWLVADILRKTAKPVILAVNKVENFADTHFLSEFYALGLGDPVPVSAAHGMNVGDLLDLVIAKLPAVTETTDDEDAIKVAVIGRPNVGKSSLVNYILGEQRSIVSNIPGTTRDAIDSEVWIDGRKYILIDTAGIRRRSRINEAAEKYSVMRAIRAVERCHVALVMIDAQEGVTEQDKRIAGLPHEAGKASILVVNKWDLVKKDSKTMHKFDQTLREQLNFIAYAPSVYVSALNGQRVSKLVELINFVDEQAVKRIPTRVLNQYLEEVTTLNPPPSDKGQSLKFFYITQSGVRPPTFVIFTNRPEQVHFSYKRYLENKFREAFGFEGSPINFIVKVRT
ncbi:MAG TPA: ribosome biogenesis GTPase Der [Clostridia bacterium]|nr:ribosome biogenesis GTPase Der [Clostridia bacterium]